MPKFPEIPALKYRETEMRESVRRGPLPRVMQARFPAVEEHTNILWILLRHGFERKGITTIPMIPPNQN